MNKPERWQFRFAPWVGQTQHGVRLVGARRNGRGEWKFSENIPAHVLEALQVYNVTGNYGGILCSKQFHSIEEMKEKFPTLGALMQQSRWYAKGFVWAVKENE